MSLMPEFEEEEIEFIKPTEEQIEEARKMIEMAHTYIEQYEFGFSAYVLRDISLSKISGLDTLARILASEEFGCGKEDVLGLIEHLEQVIRGEMPVSQGE